MRGWFRHGSSYGEFADSKTKQLKSKKIFFRVSFKIQSLKNVRLAPSNYQIWNQHRKTVKECWIICVTWCKWFWIPVFRNMEYSSSPGRKEMKAVMDLNHFSVPEPHLTMIPALTGGPLRGWAGRMSTCPQDSQTSATSAFQPNVPSQSVHSVASEWSHHAFGF